MCRYVENKQNSFYFYRQIVKVKQFLFLKKVNTVVCIAVSAGQCIIVKVTNKKRKKKE